MTGPDDPDCDFCAIIRQEEPAREVLRTDTVVAFFPLEPATLGHTLVVPREHVRDIWSADDRMAADLAVATRRVAAAVRDAVPLDGLNVIQSNGEAATQTVLHLHVHVVPRTVNDQMGRIWPDQTHWTEAAKRDAQTKIQAAMRQP